MDNPRTGVNVNALEDTREIVTTRTTLGSRHPRNLAFERAFEFGRLIEDLLRQYPDTDLATIRLIDESDTVIRVAGRRGHLIANEDPEPVTDLVSHLRDAVNRARESRLAQRPGHLVASEAFIDQDDPRGRRANQETE